jgi:hypothetical protein
MINLGGHAGMWLWNVNVEDAIPSFLRGNYGNISLESSPGPRKCEVGFRNHVGLHIQRSAGVQ